ncbi:MAG TPA: EamA family transporter, partial [Candidatus Limnocylindrales bacterium]|nr:EamA family transporter [Candidatus Limnocylindrales bacterium]
MTRGRALFYALAVVVLWSSSFLLIKYGLQSMGPVWLTFIRYEIAALALLAVSWRATHEAWRVIGPRRILLFGVLGYAVAQAPFIYALDELPTSTTLVISAVCNAIGVTSLGILFLGERPRAVSYAGIGLTLVGLFVFAGLEPMGALAPLPLLAIAVSSAGFAGWLVLGRGHMRGVVSARGVTTPSMLLGTLPLLPVALAIEPAPALSPLALGASVWLALANTALAFTLWAASQRALAAFESNL